MERPGESTVLLIDGRTVSTWSEDWRRECLDRELLALEIAQLPDKAARQRRVEALRARVSDLAAQRLVARLIALYPRFEAVRVSQGDTREARKATDSSRFDRGRVGHGRSQSSFVD